MGDTMGKRVCLAGTRTGDDREWGSDLTIGGYAVLHGPALLRIERFQI